MIVRGLDSALERRVESERERLESEESGAVTISARYNYTLKYTPYSTQG